MALQPLTFNYRFFREHRKICYETELPLSGKRHQIFEPRKRNHGITVFADLYTGGWKVSRYFLSAEWETDIENAQRFRNSNFVQGKTL